jgi:hypothetical protein
MKLMKLVKLPFNEAKAAEAAAHLLKLRGAPMSYVKLIKLLYLVDREALLRFGRPVTTDRYILTDKGPGLSQVNDLITADSVAPSDWSNYISTLQGDFEVELRKEAPLTELSEAEAELIEAIFVDFGKKTRWELIEYSQTLPEWHDPQGTKIPLDYADILKAGGKSPSEVDEIVSELESLGAVIAYLEPWYSGATPV